MSLPRAVLEAEEKANRFHEELLKQQQPPAEDQLTDPTSEAPTDHPTDPVPPTPPGDSQTPPASGQDDNWEHRFKVLQGKYNAEIPRLASENKELKGRLQDFETQLETLKNKPEPLVRPEEIEEYGEGLIDVARRIAREELATKDAKIQSLEDKLDSLSNVTATRTESDFFKTLTDKVSDWEAINENPKFLEWLGEVDELTGESRQAMLSRAEQARDALRTAKFFERFKETSSSRAAKATSGLESQVVPSTSKSSPTPPSKKVWSRGEIQDFYSRARRGDISDADAVAIEADIMAAQIEGRIR